MDEVPLDHAFFLEEPQGKMFWIRGAGRSYTRRADSSTAFRGIMGKETRRIEIR